MIRIAIVDDEKAQTDFQKTLLERYKAEHPQFLCEAFVFNNSLEFLEGYKGQYDIRFVDRERPGFSGLELCQQIRKTDPNVSIVFITNYAKYSLQGYQVQASNYLLKPVSYEDYSKALDKVLRDRKKKEATVHVKANGEIHVIPLDEIVYVEKKINNLVYHTRKETLHSKGTIKDIQSSLTDGFAKPINGVLVNLGYVTKTDGKRIYLKNGESLPLSRRLRHSFEDALIQYLEA